MMSTATRSSQLTAGAFAVVMATGPVAADSPIPPTSREVLETVDRPTKSHVYIKGWRADRIATRNAVSAEIIDISGTEWTKLADLPAAWVELVQEIEEYPTEETEPNPEDALIQKRVADDGLVVVRKLAAELPSGPVPTVGIDDDGNLVIGWDSDDLLGSLSTYGNGSYSYYVDRQGSTAGKGKADVSGDLDLRLVAVLRG